MIKKKHTQHQINILSATAEMNRDEPQRELKLDIAPTTGGNFEISLPEDSSIDELRWRVARKLQTPRDRLTFLHRER